MIQPAANRSANSAKRIQPFAIPGTRNLCSMFGSSRDSCRHSSALFRKLARISAGRIMPAVSKVTRRLEG